MDMRRLRRCLVGAAFGVMLTAAAVGGCGSSSKAAGTVGGPCFTNGTCDTGLECLSNLCVQPTGGGGAGGANGAAGGAGGQSGGAAGGGGQSAAAGANGSAGAGGACTLISDSFTLASADCRTCEAMFCCEAFNACENDSNCQLAIDHGSASGTAGPMLAPLQSCTSTNCSTVCAGLVF
jgi:hypothetical protein